VLAEQAMKLLLNETTSSGKFLVMEISKELVGELEQAISLFFCFWHSLHL
jgi:hypothetical protein